MKMFIELTKTNGQKVFYNFDRVRKFYDYKEGDEIQTVLILDYGNDLVQERSAEIAEMLKA